MKRFIEGDPRKQSVLFPERLDEWIGDDNPVRAVDAFVEELDLKELGFASAEPAATGRPAYHPGTLLRIYIYGYLNRIQSTRRDNGPAIQKVCARFVQLCRDVGLFSQALIAIDGSKFKAVNNRDRNFTSQRARAAANVRTKGTHAQWDEFELEDVAATIEFTTELVESKLDT
jgi:transposase